MASLHFTGRGDARKKKSAQTGKAQKVANSGYQRQLPRRDMTENEIAALALKSELEKYPFTSETRKALRDEMFEMDSLFRMNMKCFAGALYIISQITDISPSGDINIQPKHFSPEEFKPMRDVLEQLSYYGEDVPAKTTLARREILLAYVYAIINFRKWIVTNSIERTSYILDEDQPPDPTASSPDPAIKKQIDDIERLPVPGEDDDDDDD